MNIKPGTLLISTPALSDPNFDKAVIFITAYNEEGAAGFIINKLYPRVFNELIEFKRSIPFNLYEGGPVEKESLFFLHQRPDLIEEGILITNGIYLGGNLQQVIAHLNNKTLHSDHIKLFIGYCGWDHQQMEKEIEEGSWLICDTAIQINFSTHTELVWEILYEGIR